MQCITRLTCSEKCWGEVAADSRRAPAQPLYHTHRLTDKCCKVAVCCLSLQHELKLEAVGVQLELRSRRAPTPPPPHACSCMHGGRTSMSVRLSERLAIALSLKEGSATSFELSRQTQDGKQEPLPFPATFVILKVKQLQKTLTNSTRKLFVDTNYGRGSGTGHRRRWFGCFV